MSPAPAHRAAPRAAWSSIVLAVLALVLAACGLTGGDGSGAVGGSDASAGVPTVLVVDASSSMLRDDAPGPRIDAAKRAADGLVEALPDDAVLGLVTYGTSTDDQPSSQAAGCRDVTTLAEPRELGADGHRDAVGTAIDGLAPRGYTPIAEAMRAAADLLPDGDAAVIVVSDGEDSCGQPPCEVAAELHEQNPGLTISTVGFKTAADELACIARTTGGLFVTADDADTLTSRLLAAREVDENASALTPTGFGGIDIGAHYDDIVAAHPDFPGQGEGTREDGLTVITYVDCDYVFDGEGTVVELRPHGGRTIDGLAVGDPLSRAVELYGEPVEEPDDGTRLFAASREAGTAWKVKYSGDRVESIVLCRCLPGTGGSGSGSGGSGAGSGGGRETVTRSGDTEIVTIRPYEADGSLAAGFREQAGTPGALGWSCRVATVGDYICGQPGTDMLVFYCSVSGTTSWCPSHERTPGNPVFNRYTNTQNNGSTDYSPFPETGPTPFKVELTDGTVCTAGVVPGGGRTGYTNHYKCTTDESKLLWAPEGEAAFDTSGGTWTAYLGNNDYGSNDTIRSVPVKRVVMFE